MCMYMHYAYVYAYVYVYVSYLHNDVYLYRNGKKVNSKLKLNLKIAFLGVPQDVHKWTILKLKDFFSY